MFCEIFLLAPFSTGVILSAAKNLLFASLRQGVYFRYRKKQILRCAQNDNGKIGPKTIFRPARKQLAKVPARHPAPHYQRFESVMHVFEDR